MQNSAAEAPPVCILTAGRGTRMGPYGPLINKALLPVDKRAIISHIIDKFPAQTEFVIALGYRSEQVEAYLSQAHPAHTFHYVHVNNFDGPGSGPGHSLYKCKHLLQSPFYFVACDTLWHGKHHLSTESDWFGVAEVPSEESASYCNFAIDSQNTIVAIHDKERVEGQQYKAFVGLCFVRSHRLFWDALSTPDLIRGEHQISSGIRALVSNGSAKSRLIDWIDTGDASKYELAVRQFENFDFSKSNEFLYIVNGTVIKFFADVSIAQKRVARAELNRSVFPEVTSERSGFYSYPLVAGTTLYDECSPHLFRSLLQWLKSDLWRPATVSRDILQEKCRIFYQGKSLQRIGDYHKKYPGSNKHSIINEVQVPSVDDLLRQIPWETICAGVPVFFHGDLQFDNILFDTGSHRFTLLDWRQDFGGEIAYGDLYYDLAKLQGGLILNYDLIKENRFSYSEYGDSITIDFATRSLGARYTAILQDFVESQGLDWGKVSLMVPIIFLNMSPLHHYPFDKLLYALGRLMLWEAIRTR